MQIRIGYADLDRLLTYPDVNNLSTSSQPIRMRACQRQQPPPTLTKHSTPKVAGNSPLPISRFETISLKFRHFQHMIECFIIKLRAKVQGAHRQFTDAQRRPSAPECIKQPRPRRWMKRGRGRGWVEGSCSPDGTDVQLRRRILPVRVRRHPAAATARVMRPRNQKAGCIGGR